MKKIDGAKLFFTFLVINLICMAVYFTMEWWIWPSEPASPAGSFATRAVVLSIILTVVNRKYYLKKQA